MGKVHKGVYWEGDHDGDGFYLPDCGQAGFSYETRKQEKHYRHIAHGSYSHEEQEVSCKKCLKKLKSKGTK